MKRLRSLKHDYADPLRNFARSKNTAIIPSYEAKILFGNVDNLLPVNEAFLIDLEKMLAPNGVNVVGGVGDVALRHFKELRGFEQYKQYYGKREDAQLIFEREMARKASPFAAYIDVRCWAVFLRPIFIYIPLLADQISSFGIEKSSGTPRTSHKPRATNTPVHSDVSNDDQVHGSR